MKLTDMLSFLNFIFIAFALIIFSATTKANSDEVPSPSTARENVFNRTRMHDLASEEIPQDSTDFLQSILASLDALKNGREVTPEQLNHFSAGLNQYYLSKAYEYYLANLKPLKESYTDPVCLPNATSEDIDFYRVKVFGFPGFKQNARVRVDIDSSPFVKNYTIHYDATSDVTIVNGYFRVYNEQYYFVYHSYNNVYTTRVDKLRTNNGLLKPKSTSESLAVDREIFAHTYDSTLEHYASVNSSVYPKFRRVLREVYAPKLASFVEGVLRPSYPPADIEFGQAYRPKLREALLESANKYLRQSGHHLSYEFSPQNLTRDTIIPGYKALYTYRATVKGYLNYERYAFNSTPAEGNDSSLFMYDVVTLHYPENGDKISTIDIMATDPKNATYGETFKIKSVDIIIAYKANLSSFPIHVYRHLDKWKFTKSGFFSKIELYNFNPFYDFIKYHVQVEFAKLIGTVLEF